MVFCGFFGFLWFSWNTKENHKRTLFLNLFRVRQPIEPSLLHLKFLQLEQLNLLCQYCYAQVDIERVVSPSVFWQQSVAHDCTTSGIVCDTSPLLGWGCSSHSLLSSYSEKRAVKTEKCQVSVCLSKRLIQSKTRKGRLSSYK